VLINYLSASVLTADKRPTTESLDKLQSRFLNYQVDTLPQSVLSAKRIDVAWHQLSLIKDIATGLSKYDVLASVVKGILTMYHSNEDCERLFSTVRKNKTDFRASMSTKTLSSILTHKTMMSACSKVCYNVQHGDKLLRQAKSATYLASIGCAQTDESPQDGHAGAV
jgi:hypothetical protein